MRMRRIQILVFAFVVAMLGACASDNGTLSPSERLSSTDWRAEFINGAPVTIANPVTLSFNEGNASGRSGCNQYSGSADYDDRRITFGPSISTKMACVGAGIMETEAAYLAALQGARSFTIGPDGALTLSGASTSVRFVPQPRQIRP
jgi:heat shock protein HslJ